MTQNLIPHMMGSPTCSLTKYLWRVLGTGRDGIPGSLRSESSNIWFPPKHLNLCSTLVSLHPVLPQIRCRPSFLPFSKTSTTQGHSRVFLKGLLITKESYVVMQQSGSTTNGKFPKWNTTSRGVLSPVAVVSPQTHHHAAVSPFSGAVI